MLHKPVLVFAFGNISRGDDALGPILISQLQQNDVTSVGGHVIKYLSDYQIQVEHVTDMHGCDRVLLIDASRSLQPPFQFEAVVAQEEFSYTTHVMSPRALLHAYQQVYRQTPPATYVLAIKGECFELGENLSSSARQNLDQAKQFIESLFKPEVFQNWDIQQS